MTQDEIIEIWVTLVHKNTAGGACNFQQAAIDLANIVAAKHDPKIAIADAYRAGVDSGIAAEREACAKVCELLSLEWEDQPNIAQVELATKMDCAQAIRARSQP